MQSNYIAIQHTEKRGRNVVIEACRFFFMLIICIWHSGFIPRTLLSHGYAPVEFFFILSGYFLAKSIIVKNTTAVDYFKKKIKSFYFEIIVVAIPVLVVMHYELLFSGRAGELIQHFFNEVFLLFRVFPLHDKVPSSNPPIWFFNVLIYGGTIVTIILRFLKGKWAGLAILTFFLYCWVFDGTKCVENWDVNIIPMPLIRGVADMITGALLYKYCSDITIKNNHLSILIIISLIILTTALMFMEGIHDILFVVMYSFLIVMCNSFKKQSSSGKLNKLLIELGDLSFYIFIIHIFVIAAVKRTIFEHVHLLALLLIFTILLVLVSLGYRYICNWAKSLVFRRIPLGHKE